MDESKIARINELARKARTEEGLLEHEIEERNRLREEYIRHFRENMRATLENITIVEKDGSHTPVRSKKEAGE